MAKLANNYEVRIKDGETFSNFYSALWTAASSGDQTVIAKLLAYGLDPDHALETLNYTPLMAACFNGHLDAVFMLINGGANVNYATEYGNTALMAAAVRGHARVVELLLQRRANANATIKVTGYTALMFAAQNGCDETVFILLSYGADVRITNVDGKTAIDLAYYKRTRDRLLEAEKSFY